MFREGGRREGKQERKKERKKREGRMQRMRRYPSPKIQYNTIGMMFFSIDEVGKEGRIG